MKMFLLSSAFCFLPSAFATCLANPPCNVIRNQAVAATPLVVTEFAVPVAVPVAAASPYSYGYATNGGFDSTGIVAELRALRTELSRAGGSNVAASNSVAAKPSLVQQTCAKCHGGPEPKAGVSLENLAALDDATRLQAAAAVLSDRMPKGGKLDADTAGKLLLELTKKPNAAVPQPLPVPANPTRP
jgi:hypothetical protein